MFELFRVNNAVINGHNISLGCFPTENGCLNTMRANTKKALATLRHPESVYYMVDSTTNGVQQSLEMYVITAMDDWGKGAIYPNYKGWKYHHYTPDYSKNEYIDLNGNVITK